MPLFTTGSLSAETDISPATIRLYFDSGLLPGDVDTNGHRTFPPMAVEIARTVHVERLARVGRAPKTTLQPRDF